MIIVLYDSAICLAKLLYCFVFSDDDNMMVGDKVRQIGIHNRGRIIYKYGSSLLIWQMDCDGT